MRLLLIVLIIVGAKQVQMDRFSVNLDEPPEMRWKEVFLSKKEVFKSIIGELDNYFNPILREYAGRLLLKADLFGSEIISEMKSAAEFLEIDLPSVVIGNFLYDFLQLCNYVIARNSSGSVYLARNLDGYVIENLSIEIDFYKDNKFLYRSSTFVGYFGVVTALKPGAFSLALNTKKAKDSSILWIIHNLISSHMMAPFALRYAIENFNTYEEALMYLNEVPLVTGTYIGIAGSNQGASISRNSMYLSGIKRVDIDNWFIVQTNYENWIPQPEDDDRYNPTVQNINGLGKEGVNEGNLFRVMTTNPTFRAKNYTTYTLQTVVMSIDAGLWKGVYWGD